MNTDHHPHTDHHDIVYLETNLQRMRGRWQAMSRIARLGIVSILFGGIGFASCWFAGIVSWLSIPFAMIGLVLGTVSMAAGFYFNRKRDGFWFPLIGFVLSLTSLSIGFNTLAVSGDRSRQAELERIQQVQSQFLGQWERQTGKSNGKFQELEFTLAGSAFLRPLRGDAMENENSASESELIGRFEIKTDRAVIGFQSGRNLDFATVYEFEFLAPNQLLLRKSSALGDVDLSGRWKRIGTPATPAEIDQDVQEYRSQLSKFRYQRRRIDQMMNRFQGERTNLLEQLSRYEKKEDRDERWEIMARQLNALVKQIDVVQFRAEILDTVIVRLEAAIANRTRQVELEAGMSREELEEILLTTDKLDDELKAADASQIVEYLELDHVVEQELRKK